ncbi:MAG TPA: adenylate/guanylate cyclase domain-containing protein [Kiloniellales bacterium]|nr:adenylate/guanylate cyclase domain-containing protein [Kiloniellales bacterium]
MSEVHSTPLYENILANMADGVISLDLDGRVTTFNAAAGRILGLDPASVVGQPYAAVFFEEAGFDDFNELVLRAIYESATTHSRQVQIGTGTEERWLLMSTTFLRASAQLHERKLGVIVVFSDITEQYRRQRVEKLFGAYVDPRIVERLIRQGDVAADGVRQVMSVLFCDLEGFTRIVERLDAEQLIAFVNLYLSTMSGPVARHAGVTDKYIGDTIMAFWGPPFTDAESHARQACAAALEQRAVLGHFRTQARALLGVQLGDAPIELRCGIATGEVVAGNVGPPQARNFTVIGDTVNVAARLEAAGKDFGARILVSERTWMQARDRFTFRELAEIPLRGRSRPERVYELLDHRPGP